MNFDRLCAIILVFIMCFSMLPNLVFAENGGSATAPVFDTNLCTDIIEYDVGDDADALTVTASVYGSNDTLTYQWYFNTEESTAGGIIIEDETDPNYTPSTATPGTTYYYVVATNTESGKTPATITSNIACVVVNEVELANSVTAYLFVENTTLRKQGKTNFRAEVDSVLPLREVTVTLSDIETINSVLESSLGLPVETLNDTKYRAIHFLVKAMMDMGDADPYSHITLVKETASGSYVFAETLSVTPRSAEGYYISSLTLGRNTVTGLNWEITTYKSESSQQKNKWYSVTYPMQCMVITDGNTTSKGGSLLETSVSSGDILGLTREVRAFTKSSTDNISPFYKMSPLAVSSVVDEASLLTLQLQTVEDGTVADVDLEEGSDQETKLYKYSDELHTYSEIEHYNGSGLYVHRICSSGYYDNDIEQGNSEKAYLSSAYSIVTLEDVSYVDKTALQSAIKAVPMEGYYTIDDRWNGVETSENGFWTDMQTTLTVANAVYNNTVATQEEVDTASANLQTAIDKLIPTTNVNATLLYEAVLLAQTKTADEYTTDSWSVMQNEINNANAMLESLCDDGSPTDINTSDYQIDVETQATALTTAIDGLDTLVTNEFNNNFYDALYKYDSLEALYNTLFAGLNQEDYTPESWNAFTSAQSEVAAYFAAYPDRPTEENYGNIAYEALKSAYAEFVSAAYGLTSNDESISVTLTVVDNLAARKDEVDFITSAGTYSLTLNDGHTVADALNQAGVTTDIRHISGNDISNNQAYTIFVNGVLVCGPNSNMGSNSLRDIIRRHEASVIQLQNGDAVTVAYLDCPYFVNASSAPTIYAFNEVANDVRLSDLSGSVTVEAGQETTYTATSCVSFYAHYNGGMSALSGATVFVKAPSGNTFENTGVETGSDGSFSYTFYEEGTFQVSVYPLKDNNYDEGIIPGLIAGATITVNVTEPSDPSAVLSTLKAELEAVYNTYDESYYTADDWLSIQSYYKTGIEGIQSATTIRDASVAQKTAIAAIKAIQDKTTLETNEKLSHFRGLLNRLPDDITLLGASAQELVNALIESYNGMSAYQQGMVTGIELATYNDIVDANTAGLPSLDPYQLEINIEADNDEAKVVIEDMITYLQNKCDLVNPLRLNKFTWFSRDISGNYSGNSSYGVTTAFPDNEIVMDFNVGYYGYYLVRDSETSTQDGNIFSAEGANWSISDKEFKLEEKYDWRYYYEAQNDFTVYINGEEYEIKSIQYDGIESSSVSLNTRGLSDETNYKGKEINYHGVFFNDAQLSFIMPYNDVGVTITWGPVSGSTVDQAIMELTAAFESYNRKDYTIENWEALLAAYKDGLAAIEEAKTDAAIETAKTDAIDTMAAVEKKTPEDVQDVGNSNFDAGDQVGTVDLYIENYTYSGGDFTGKIINKRNYALGEKDTMMTVALRALAEEGYSWTGTGGSSNVGAYDIAYLASITKDGKELGEFSGARGSGWMGTLNDWFTNEGFQKFSVENGNLGDDDEIRIQYTQKLGADIGGSWGNDDTALEDLDVSTGTLTPAFSADENEFALVISGKSARVKVTPTATNKNYLVKTFLNKKVTTNAEGNSYYKRTEYIPVVPGDTVYIGVGEHAWPSMNNQETEAIDYTGTWYELHVISASNGASYVNEVISDLPKASKITMGNYENHRDTIEYARTIYNILDKTEQTKVDVTKLYAAEEKLVFYDEIENVKNLLNAIPDASKVTLSHKSAVMAADKAYKALTEEQKLYITVGNVENYNAAIEKLTDLGAFDSGDAPSTIKGSEEEPEEIETTTITIRPEAEVSGGKARVNVSKESLKEIIEQGKNGKVSNITITPKIDGDVEGIIVTLPKVSVSSMANEAGIGMKISTEIAELTMPKEVLTKISKETGSDISIGIEKVESNSLSEENKALVNNHPVYDFSIFVGDSAVTSLGGKVTVSLPYTPQPGESTEKLTIYNIDENGKAIEMEGAKYDIETNCIVFKTDHFSLYAIVHDDNKMSVKFNDVADTHWAKEYIYYLAEKGIIKGKTENTFAPEDSITRAEFAALLARISGDDMLNASSKFVDVNESAWYAPSVAWAVNAGITLGTSENTFSPDNMITRQDMAVMIFRYAKYKSFRLPADFPAKTFLDDIEIRGSAKNAVSAMQQAGIISGRDDNIFAPNDKATRAETVKMLNVLIQIMSK